MKAEYDRRYAEEADALRANRQVPRPATSRARGASGSMFELFYSGQVEQVRTPTETVEWVRTQGAEAVSELKRHAFEWEAEISAYASSLDGFDETFVTQMQGGVLAVLARFGNVSQDILLHMAHAAYETEEYNHQPEEFYPLLSFRHWPVHLMDPTTAWAEFVKSRCGGIPPSEYDWVYRPLASWYDRAGLPLHGAAVAEALRGSDPDLNYDDIVWALKSLHLTYTDEGYPDLANQRLAELETLGALDPYAKGLADAVDAGANQARTECSLESALGRVWDELSRIPRHLLTRAEDAWASEDGLTQGHAAQNYYTAVEAEWQQQLRMHYRGPRGRRPADAAICDAIIRPPAPNEPGQTTAFMWGRPDPGFLFDRDTLDLLRQLKRLRNLVSHGSPLTDEQIDALRELRSQLLAGGFLKRYFAALIGGVHE